NRSAPVQKWWSIFFGAVLFAILAFTALSPAFGWWLPPNIATFGGAIDMLFYIILGFVTFFYVLPCGVLVWAMYRYAHDPGRRADYTHGNHKLEIAWTAVPAAILLFIAFAQIRTWAQIKYQSRFPEPDLTVQVTAQQWQWELRYPADTD